MSRLHSIIFGALAQCYLCSLGVSVWKTSFMVTQLIVENPCGHQTANQKRPADGNSHRSRPDQRKEKSANDQTR